MNVNHLLVSLTNNVRLVQFNRPALKNAIGFQICQQLTNIFNEDATNPNVAATILTGVGDYYSSGIELQIVDGEELHNSCVRIRCLIDSFIDYPKPIIALVNGPSIGIATTTLGLCDIVYASDRATFHTPFVKLGLCAEGCSSYLFPHIMGKSRAAEMLLLGKKLSAKEALDARLVSEIVPHEKLDEFLRDLFKYGSLPGVTLQSTKKLMNIKLQKKLHEVNRLEMEMVYECFNSDYFMNAALAFFAAKNKL